MENRSQLLKISLFLAFIMLGLPAILLLGIFQFKDHRAGLIAEAVFSDLATISHAEKVYFSKYEKYATPKELVRSGVLPTFPTPPKGAIDSWCVESDGAGTVYEVSSLKNMVPGDTNLYVVLPCIKKDVGLKINAMQKRSS